MIKCKEVTNEIGFTYIEKIDEDGKIWSVPMDSANADYQIYLAEIAAWEAERQLEK